VKFLFATNNAHKLEEARNILPQHTILSLREVGLVADIPETADTLDGNSLQKAEFVYRWCCDHAASLPADLCGCFADDTGLEITALDMAPGVYTARWSGEPVDEARNRRKALTELQGKVDRSARFRTVVTLIRWDSLNTMHDAQCAMHDWAKYEGIVCGTIADAERGDHGFGYDPLFIPEGYDRTFAELPAEIKNTISHRARAMQALAEAL